MSWLNWELQRKRLNQKATHMREREREKTQNTHLTVHSLTCKTGIRFTIIQVQRKWLNPHNRTYIESSTTNASNTKLKVHKTCYSILHGFGRCRPPNKSFSRECWLNMVRSELSPNHIISGDSPLPPRFLPPTFELNKSKAFSLTEQIYY